MRGIAQIVFDKQFHKLPAFTGDAPVDLFGAAIQPQSFWVLGGTAVIVILLYAFLELTLLGKAVLATAANRLAAHLVGINTRTVMALAFGGSAAIGAVAGILITPITLTSYDVGTLLALKGFAAAMLGGMGNPLGAVTGGILIGLLSPSVRAISVRLTRTLSHSLSFSWFCLHFLKACSVAVLWKGSR